MTQWLLAVSNVNSHELSSIGVLTEVLTMTPEIEAVRGVNVVTQ